MKTLITILFAAITFSGFSQSFPSSSSQFETHTTTVSKSCGSCGGVVSSNSTIGMRCPHCGVRWGYENTQHSTTHSIRTIPTSGTATTNASVNLRSGPSTDYTAITTIPAYTQISILSKSGSWVKVTFTDYLGYFGGETKTGWVFASLLDF